MNKVFEQIRNIEIHREYDDLSIFDWIQSGWCNIEYASQKFGGNFGHMVRYENLTGWGYGPIGTHSGKSFTKLCFYDDEHCSCNYYKYINKNCNHVDYMKLKKMMGGIIPEAGIICSIFEYIGGISKNQKIIVCQNTDRYFKFRNSLVEHDNKVEKCELYAKYRLDNGQLVCTDCIPYVDDCNMINSYNKYCEICESLAMFQVDYDSYCFDHIPLKHHTRL